MKIVFLQIKSFLLSQKNTNPLFDPLIEICDRHGIKWEVWLRGKALHSGYPSKNVRQYCWKDVLSTATFLIFHRVFRLNLAMSYRLSRFILNHFHLLDREVSLFITNALLNVEDFTFLYPSVKKIEIQHGIIYPSHFAYFSKNGIIHEKYLNNDKLLFWLFGKGYEDIFERNEINKKSLEGRISIIGDLRRNRENCFEGKKNRNLIVIASQIVPGPEFSPETILEMKLTYEETINNILQILKTQNIESQYNILFRHHPRFSNCIDLSNWKDKYPSLVMNDTRDWDEIYPETKCLLTINSTSAFDAAAYGVPTIIINATQKKLRNILAEDFKYPLPHLTLEKCLNMDDSTYEETRRIAHSWYKAYYSSFDSTTCKKLLLKALSS
jgi:hypothetical protein